MSAAWWVAVILAVYGACLLGFLALALRAPRETDVWGDEDPER